MIDVSVFSCLQKAPLVFLLAIVKVLLALELPTAAPRQPRRNHVRLRRVDLRGPAPDKLELDEIRFPETGWRKLETRTVSVQLRISRLAPETGKIERDIFQVRRLFERPENYYIYYNIYYIFLLIYLL